MSKYRARWGNRTEEFEHGERNGVVEDISLPGTTKRVCFVSPMSMAIRIAALLNFGEKFSADEITHLGAIFDDQSR